MIYMNSVFDYAKYFVKNGNGFAKNSFDGNMKLQKLLVFSNFISFVEDGECLFSEEMLAYKNGCVVEPVRLRYRHDYNGFMKDCSVFEPNFSEEEYRFLNMTLDIFGDASARELSELNHQFDFWSQAYENGIDSNGFHDKSKEVVDFNSHQEDVERMRNIICAYKESKRNLEATETINGVVFYYDGFEMTDEIINQLEDFSLVAEDSAYSVFFDDGEMVIY